MKKKAQPINLNHMVNSVSQAAQSIEECTKKFIESRKLQKSYDYMNKDDYNEDEPPVPGADGDMSTPPVPGDNGDNGDNGGVGEPPAVDEPGLPTDSPAPVMDDDGDGDDDMSTKIQSLSDEDLRRLVEAVQAESAKRGAGEQDPSGDLPPDDGEIDHVYKSNLNKEMLSLKKSFDQLKDAFLADIEDQKKRSKTQKSQVPARKPASVTQVLEKSQKPDKKPSISKKQLVASLKKSIRNKEEGASALKMAHLVSIDERNEARLEQFKQDMADIGLNL